jgi:transcriptional regulator with GAF, ATPase, and Fis domain
VSDDLLDGLENELRALLERARATGGDSAIERLRAIFEAVGSDGDGMAVDDGDAEWHGFVGRCPAILEMRERIQKFAATNAPVLLRGESGTGKDLVARILHELGPRASGPFVAENCAAIPETLLESTLFGHVRGAFTGAVRDHGGHFVAAHKGTLFLDEIGDMPLPMQAKVLRALQEGEVRPVGGQKVRKVDVRVIAATHRDLEAMVQDGAFREDLFYRLNVLEVFLPPLRERGDDIVLLARRILQEAAAKAGRSLRLASETEEVLLRARWPGNVRQLQNELQRVAALADGPLVRPGDLSPDLQ